MVANVRFEGPCADCADYEKGLANLMGANQRLRDERGRLRELVEFALSETWGHGNPYMGGDIDGGGFQDKAEELGLIERRPIPPERSIDGETAHYFPVWAPKDEDREASE